MSRIAEILGAVPATAPLVQATSSAPSPTHAPVAYVVGPAAGMGAVGAYMWKKHRVLGGLLGIGVGGSAYDLVKGDRKHAMFNIGIAGAGTAGALMLKKRMHPALGWMTGTAAGMAAAWLAKKAM